MRSAELSYPTQSTLSLPQVPLSSSAEIPISKTIHPQSTSTDLFDPVKAQFLTMLASNNPINRISHWPERFGGPDKAVFNARQQLIDQGAPLNVVDTLFTSKGEWKHVDESDTDFLTMNPDEAFEYITTFLQPEFHAVTTYLDEPNGPERPYNDHGVGHARRVKDISKKLLTDSGHIGPSAGEMRELFEYSMDLTPEEIEMCSSVAAAIHDVLGYILNPELHPAASVTLADKVFPQLKKHPKLSAVINQAVLLHEGDSFDAELRRRGINSTSDAIALLRQLSPVVSAIRLADKIDQNEHRARTGEILDVKAKLVDPRTFLEDVHVEDNLLMRVTSAEWVPQKVNEKTLTSFDITVDFTQEIPKGMEKNFHHYLTNRSSRDGQKIDVSQRTRKQYLESGGKIEYFDILMTSDLAIGAKRKLQAVIASFALNPMQDMSNITYQDKNRPNRVRKEHFTFFRDSIDEDAAIFSLYAEEAKRSVTPKDLRK